ncbi:hypothetical protein QBC40DRAFT_227599 [Triangularia verruculosa]|uniref:SnoaL-like domain-containing protein n=1 Tax=Triangularia verruculosa TaxID=2587418 RepID=A0AAN6XFE3_9PEZI|nr:hypothetical protein QBC40DRAFT_227599 [Triangularia verruculosa]
MASQSQSQQPLRLTPHDGPPSRENETTTTTTQPQQQQQQQQPPFTSPRALLEYLYKDVTRFSHIASPACVLHPADRSAAACLGIQACQAHEENLVAATRGTLKMEVEQITVSSSGEFGCVMGAFELGGCGEVREPFCGVWRFEVVDVEGKKGVVRAVEHWENLTPEGGGRVRGWVERGGGVRTPLAPLRPQQTDSLPHLLLKQRPELKLDKLRVNHQLPRLLNAQVVQVHVLWPPALPHLDEGHAQDIGNVLGVLLLCVRDLLPEPAVEHGKLGDVLLVERGERAGLRGSQRVSERRQGGCDDGAWNGRRWPGRWVS